MALLTEATAPIRNTKHQTAARSPQLLLDAKQLHHPTTPTGDKGTAGSLPPLDRGHQDLAPALPLWREQLLKPPLRGCCCSGTHKPRPSQSSTMASPGMQTEERADVIYLGRAADAPEGCAAVPQEGLQSCTPAVLHPIPGSSVQTKRGISWKKSGRGPQRRCRAWSTSMMKFAEGLTSLPPEVPSSTYNPCNNFLGKSKR